MLPFRGLRDEVSKSNSLSLVPSTTTTRVSSGWLASISMRRAMGALLETLGTDHRRERPVGLAASLARGGRSVSTRRTASLWPRRGSIAPPDRGSDPANLEGPDEPH